jgi:hypothetical protein
MVLMAVVTACTSAPIESTTTSGENTTSTVLTTTTTAGETTSTTAGSSALVRDFPLTAACDLGSPPIDGEITVVVGGRLYGVAAETGDVRCLMDEIDTTDFAWGPQGDRLRVGTRAMTPDGDVTLPASGAYEWTAPTGKSVMLVEPDRVAKVAVDGSGTEDITFLATTDAAVYHPSGTRVLAIGTDFDGQYGLFMAANTGADPTLLAFDEGAVMTAPGWTGAGEPLFVAAHNDGPWHVHKVVVTEDGALEGPILEEGGFALDRLMASSHDPLLVAFRRSAASSPGCSVDGRATVIGVDLPEPLASMTSAPSGWLPGERLLVLSYPGGCDGAADLWLFSAGFCPGSVYGASLIATSIDGAAARTIAPAPPPVIDVGTIINPAPA